MRQSLNYYPFGMRLEGQSYTNPLQAAANKYLYNGKELQDDLGLDWYDYGARFYDPALGRFLKVDPIAEDFPHVTPYNYAENEPVAHIDLWGLQKFYVMTLDNSNNGWARNMKKWSGGLIEHINIPEGGGSDNDITKTIIDILKQKADSDEIGIVFLAIIGVHGSWNVYDEKRDELTYGIYPEKNDNTAEIDDVEQFKDVNFMENSVTFISACNSTTPKNPKDTRNYVQQLSKWTKGAVIGANDDSKGTYSTGTYLWNTHKGSAYLEYMNGLPSGDRGEIIDIMGLFNESKLRLQRNNIEVPFIEMIKAVEVE
ncbi:MAG: RHS repeat-associated core domain-containing protein [Bacteroidota bacterium]